VQGCDWLDEADAWSIKVRRAKQFPFLVRSRLRITGRTEADPLTTRLITVEGYARLKEELDYLWREKRPDTTRKVTWAASLGDRSENADYQYNKKLLREIDRRVRYLRKRIEDLKVVEHRAEQDGRVFFGAWVEVESDDGDARRFRVVGYDEIFGRKDYISIDSPMARALLGKSVGDEVVVVTPEGEMGWVINAIDYTA
tara:strand:+ start:53115 stop:53711 length:597 start_codon:yes stop_codon:yes gene_type:complete